MLGVSVAGWERLSWPVSIRASSIVIKDNADADSGLAHEPAVEATVAVRDAGHCADTMNTTLAAQMLAW